MKSNRVYIEVMGGCVVNVRADDKRLEVKVIDHDNADAAKQKLNRRLVKESATLKEVY
jgi:hypothetical protein